ncbi:MAG: aminopeptidase P family N-terminal domain-containing protein, partial [Bacteroidales bacterium]|nr:aminopeptidase P family N-terminal domain-containing protein [Bacteroidales bacterium]
MATNIYRKRLAGIRALMKKKGLDALIVPSSDPHLGEYVPDHWRAIRWLTGFTGSTGNVVITQKFAGLWTDSRYFIQATDQLMNSGFELVRLRIPHTPEHIEWLTDKVKKEGRVGADGRLISAGMARQLSDTFETKGIRLDLRSDLITPLWKDRPPLPAEKAFTHQVKFAGETRKEKISRIRERMAAMKADWQLLTATDD